MRSDKYDKLGKTGHYPGTKHTALH